MKSLQSHMVLKLGIFELRFYVFLKYDFKKRKKSRFFCILKKKTFKNVFSNYITISRTNLCDFLCDVVLDVRYDGQFVAVMFHRGQVTAVTLTVLQGATQVRTDLARERRPSAAVADRDVPGLGQLKPNFGRVD